MSITSESEVEMVMDGREEVDELKKLAANAASAGRLRLLIQRAIAESAAEEEEEEEKSPNSIIHPDYHRLLLDEDLLQFGISFCRLPLSAICDFILSICLAFPHSLPDRLRAIAKFSIWIFFFDDMFDDSNNLLSADPVRTSTIMSMTLRSLASPSSFADTTITTLHDDTNIDRKLLDDVLCGAASWWAEFRQLGMPPIQQRRFLDAFEAYVAAVFRQTRYSRSATFPADLDSYISMRTHATGILFNNLLAEFSMGLDVLSNLRPDIRGLEPALEALGLKAGLSFVWLNDLMSLAKEMEEGDHMNVITYLYVQDRRGGKLGSGGGGKEEEETALVKVEEALKVAQSMVRECRVEARRLEAEIEELLSAEDGKEEYWLDVLRYARVIRQSVAGLKRWLLQSFRYAASHPPSPQNQT